MKVLGIDRDKNQISLTMVLDDQAQRTRRTDEERKSASPRAPRGEGKGERVETKRAPAFAARAPGARTEGPQARSQSTPVNSDRPRGLAPGGGGPRPASGGPRPGGSPFNNPFAALLSNQNAKK